MVVDIGGGTVDITVHDKSNGGISVVLPPMGNTCGGTTINEALSMLLEEAVGDKGFQSFIESDPISARATLNKFFYEEFEERKKRFGDAIECLNEIALSLPRTFMRHYGSDKLHEASNLNMHYDPGDDSLSIGYDLLEEKIFKSTVDKIIECVRAAFGGLTDHIDTVYLVGGFGGCRFVSQKIEEAIAQHCGILYDNIVCPKQPDLAVVSGAVMWRKDPNIIQSRVADATYGIECGPVFDPSMHDEHYKFLDEEDGVQCCRNVFEVFVLKGEVIKDEVYKTTFIPLYQSTTKECIPIYSTADDRVLYTRDKEGKLTVREIGEIILEIPNPDNIPRNERDINVFMDFSGTEIQARAQYSITGEEVKTVCDFLTNQN